MKEEAIEKLKSNVLTRDTKDLNHSVFYAKDKNVNIKAMLDLLNTAPFLSKKRLVILRQADGLLKSDRDSVLFYLHNPKKTSIFVMESSSSAIKGEFLLEASKLTKLFYFRKLSDRDLDTWLIRTLASSGKKITREASDFIKEALSNNLRLLFSNINNIILYIGKRPLITKKDAEEVIGISPSHTAFDLLDCIRCKDTRKALKVFSRLKKDRKSETELLGLLAWNARMLFRVRELVRIKTKLEAHRELALNPRVFDQLVRQASGISKDTIVRLLKEIIAADLDIKTGVSARDTMERLIVKLCSEN